MNNEYTCGNALTENSVNTDLLIDTAQLAALIVLESGGETSRAEEIATIICRNGGRSEAEAIVLPTGAFLTVQDEKGRKMSSAARIKVRGVNLFKVERANSYSRAFCAGRIDLETLYSKLKALRTESLYGNALMILAAGASASAFTLLFEPRFGLSVLFDIAVAFIATVLSQLAGRSSKVKNTYQFTVTFISSIIIAVISLFAVKLSGIGNLDCIIVGSIMPLLPGLSLTNAIRDTVMGDIISGTVRIVETLMIAMGIAAGVGLVLIAYINMGGVL